MADQVATVPEIGSVESTGSARIANARVEEKEIAVSAIGSFGAGIGRVGFVLVDLGNDQPANAVERKDIHYAAPLPKQVSEVWTSAAPLTPGTTYRAFFHVYDRSGTNLVAYDRRDLTCPDRGHGKPEVER